MLTLISVTIIIIIIIITVKIIMNNLILGVIECSLFFSFLMFLKTFLFFCLYYFIINESVIIIS